MPKIGITGGTGFIGSYLLKDYSENAEWVVATSQDIRNDSGSNIRYVKTDYSQKSFVQIFKGCDAVIHLGSHVMHNGEQNIDIEPLTTNVTLADNLFSACCECGVSNIVNASTVAVYNIVHPHKEDSLKESDFCRPNNVYGISKLSIERLADLYNERYGLNIKSLRFAQGLGYSQKLPRKRFWGVLLYNSLRGEAIPVWQCESGRDIIYVRDMAYAAICAANKPDVHGIFNIGCGRVFTNVEIARAYCDVFENKAGIQIMDTGNETITRTYLDIHRAKEILDFTPRFDLYGMVQDIKTEANRERE